MSDRAPLVFSETKLHEEDVVIGSKTYILKEADAGIAAEFRNAQISCAKLSKGKAVGVNGLANTQILLVHLCLFERSSSNADVPIPEQLIRSWKAHIVEAIFDRIREVSALKDEERTVASIKAQITELQEELKELQEEEEERKNE